MTERNDAAAENIVDNVEDLSQFFGTAQEVVERYTHCALCGANLHFTHVTDFAHNLTQETARCPECNVRARQIIHKLQ